MARLRHPTQEVVAVWLLQVPNWRPWSLEGPVRHYIRSDLCLQGSRWVNADLLAKKLVARARSLTNGQPAPKGWDSDNQLAEWLPVECYTCGRFYHRIWSDQVYCSSACRLRAAECTRWAEARGGPTAPPQCQFCNQFFEPDYPQQIYCCHRCLDRSKKQDQRERADKELGQDIANARRAARWTQVDLARRLDIHERYLGAIEEGIAVASRELMERIWAAIEDAPTGRTCAWCGEEIPPGKDPRAKFCRYEHATAWHNDARRKRNGHALPNGHDTTATALQSDAPLHHTALASSAATGLEKR